MVAIGYEAFKDFTGYASGNADGHSVAVGYQAGSENTVGTANTYIGSWAGKNGTESNNNIAVGFAALKNNTLGDQETALGVGAMETYNQTSDVDGNNVAVGYATGFALTTGVQNTLIGASAGDALTTGTKNAVLGYNALGAGTTYNGNTAIGWEALKVANNTDGPDGNNVAIGSSAGAAVTSSIKNVLIGVSCAETLRTGSDNVMIGRQADVSASGAANQITIGPGIACDQDSQVTIGKASNVVKLEFDTDATWTRTSDVRKKKNIENSTLGLDFVNDLRPVTFEWKPNNEFPKDFAEYSEENYMTTGVTMHGIIAQEVKSALDKQNVDNFGGWKEDNDGSQRIAQDMFIYPLIKAMQELSAQVDTLKEEIKELKNG